MYLSLYININMYYQSNKTTKEKATTIPFPTIYLRTTWTIQSTYTTKV